MTRIRVHAVVLFVAMLSVASCFADEPEGFVSIFDGKTFDDLRVKAESVSRMVGGWRACKRKGRAGNRSSGNGSSHVGGRSEETDRDDRRPAYQER